MGIIADHGFKPSEPKFFGSFPRRTNGPLEESPLTKAAQEATDLYLSKNNTIPKTITIRKLSDLAAEPIELNNIITDLENQDSTKYSELFELHRKLKLSSQVEIINRQESISPEHQKKWQEERPKRSHLHFELSVLHKSVEETVGKYIKTSSRLTPDCHKNFQKTTTLALDRYLNYLYQNYPKDLYTAPFYNSTVNTYQYFIACEQLNQNTEISNNERGALQEMYGQAIMVSLCNLTTAIEKRRG